MRDGESETIITIPPVIGLVIVGVQIATVVAISVEQVRIAIRIVRNITCATAP